MRKRLLPPALVIAVAAGIAGFATPGIAGHKFLLIGGASETGIYYQVALGVCKLVNEKLQEQGYTCSGRPSLGSVFNIKAVQRGLLDFGVAQSDRNWQAYKGKGDWRRKPYEGLRSVFSIHAETVMLVTRAKTGITSVNDIRGKRVNIGNPGSGHRGNAEQVLEIYDIGHKSIIARGFTARRATEAFVKNKIDAFFYTVGNPWKSGQRIATAVNIQIIPIDGPGIKTLVFENPYYVMTTIPGGMYRGVDKDVPTFGVKATLVTSVKQSEETVYNVVKTVFDNLDRFRKMNAAFAFLTPQEMLKGLSAPIHAGALRYYKEKGWL
ncbi:MAG: TAXI family TRAP transporter solute-binding subunit [Acidiferrobacterales bacterium]